MSPVKFEDNDAGYLQWIGANPSGYILNGYRPLTPDYLVIHRADKNCVRKLQRGAQFWTRDYTKVCSLDLEPLETWARQNVGGRPKRCGNCKPE